MSKNIFDISAEYLAIIAEVEDVEGDLTEELENRLKINAEELEAKVKAYNHIISHNKGEISIIDDEIDRLSKLKSSKANLIEKLKKYLLEAVLTFGYLGKTNNRKLDFDTIKLYTQDSESVEIKEDEFLDFEYEIRTSFTKEQIEKIEALGIPLKIEGVISKTKIKEKILADEGANVKMVTPNLFNQYKKSIISSETVKGASIVKKTGIRIK